MTILGLGLAPLGTSPAGVGLPSGSAPLCQVGTYGAVSSVLYNPATHDAMIDSAGNELACDDDTQRVQFCLDTLRGSRLNFLSFGFKAPAYLSLNVQRETFEAVRLALLPLISDGTIELVNVLAEVDPGNRTRLNAFIEWRSLRRGTQSQSARIALQG